MNFLKHIRVFDHLLLKTLGLGLLLGVFASCQDFSDNTATVEPDPNLKFSDEVLNISYEEQEIEGRIESNLPWRVASSASWISVLTPNGQSSGNYKMAVTKNGNVTPRETTLDGWIVASNKLSLRVVQDGVGIALKKRSLKVDGAGTVNAEIPFQTMVDYTCTLSDGCNWVHITEQPAATPGVVADLSLRLTVDAYAVMNEEGRSASLFLTGSNGVTDELVITQDRKDLEDIDYLRLFYEGANGINWTKQWNFSSTLETNDTNWYGLTVENGRVVEITIQSPIGIEGDISPLCYLTELRSIKFKHQKIKSIPKEIGQLTKLATLWIIESAGEGTIPDELGDCQLLTSFNISNHPTTTPDGFNNQFTGGLDALLRIPGIVTIKAYCNNLNGGLPVIPLDANNQPTTWLSLKEFLVYSNSFSGSIPYGYGTVIEKSGSSGIFRVENNQLSGKIPDDLKAWSLYTKRRDAWIMTGNSLTE